MDESYKTFLEYYRKNEICLNESPMRLGRSFGDDLDNDWFNVKTSDEVINNYQHVTNINILNNNFNLYRDSYTDNKFMDYWITKQPFIGCYYIFQIVKDNGLQSLGVWNHRKFKGSAIEILFDFYLKKYDFVMSDNKHTTQGETFWKKIIQKATDEKHEIKVISRNEKEYDIDDVDSYWGSANEFSDYRIKIYSK